MNSLQNSSKHVVAICNDVRVYDNPYIVEPGRLAAKEGDDVVFQNLSDVIITIKFLNGKTPFNEDGFEVNPDIAKEPIALNGTSGSYPYRILCGDMQKPADGSLPIIIIIKK